jgi:hypothetical protein
MEDTKSRWLSRLFNINTATGRIGSFRKPGLVFFVSFTVMGIASLIWFLVRVIPKPSRATYPCMNACDQTLEWHPDVPRGIYIIKLSIKGNAVPEAYLRKIEVL